MASSDGDGENSSEDAVEDTRHRGPLSEDEDDDSGLEAQSPPLGRRLVLALTNIGGLTGRSRRLASVVATVRENRLEYEDCDDAGTERPFRPQGYRHHRHRQPRTMGALRDRERVRSRSPVLTHAATFRGSSGLGHRHGHRLHGLGRLGRLGGGPRVRAHASRGPLMLSASSPLSLAGAGEEEDDEDARYGFPSTDDEDTMDVASSDHHEEVADEEDDEEETAPSTQTENNSAQEGEGMEQEDEEEEDDEEEEEQEAEEEEAEEGDAEEEDAEEDDTADDASLSVQQRVSVPALPLPLPPQPSPQQQHQQGLQQQQRQQQGDGVERAPGLAGSLLEILECPVCYEAMRPPIWQCSRGHLVCKDCSPRLRRCPTCRCSARRTRNCTIEKVCDKLRYPCRFRGCGATLPPGDLDAHEQAACAHRDSACRVPRCAWRGADGQLLEHARAAHARVCREGRCGTPVTVRVPVWGTPGRHCRLLDHVTHLFFVHFLVDASTSRLSACVQLFGPPLQARAFEYRVELDEGGGSASATLRRMADIQDRINYFQARLQRGSHDDEGVPDASTWTSGRVLGVDEDPALALRGPRAWRVSLTRARTLSSHSRSGKARVIVTVWRTRARQQHAAATATATTAATTTTTTTTTA